MRLRSQFNAVVKDRGLHKSVVGAASRSLQPILLNALSVPVMAYIIRELGATSYGDWSTATSLVATTAFLSSLGLRGTFIRDVARDATCAARAFADQLGTRMVLSLLTTLITVTICLALRYPPVILQCVFIAAAGMFLTTIATTSSDLMESFQRLPATAVVAMIAGLVLTAGSAVAIWLGAGPVGLSVAYLLGPLISALMLLHIVRRAHCPIRAHFSTRRTMHLIWQSRHFTMQQMLAIFSMNFAMVMLPPIVGPAQFGLFSAGVLLISRLSVFPDSIGTAFYPLLAKSSGTNLRAVRRNALLGIALSVATCVAVALPVTVLSTWIAHVLFPKSPAECRHVMALTIWALPLLGIETMMTYASNAAGLEAAQARTSIWATLAGLAAGAVLMIGWKVEGACWFMLLRSFVRIIFILPVFIKSISVRSSGPKAPIVPLHQPVGPESFEKVIVGVQR